jgi:hypothetical protein
MLLFVDTAGSPSQQAPDFSGSPASPAIDFDATTVAMDPGSVPPALEALRTARPRIVHAESDSDREEDQPLEGPVAIVDGDDADDLGPELDEELLTRQDLTAAELLEDELVSEEMRRRECSFALN